MNGDTLSELLQAVRITGAAFFDAESPPVSFRSACVPANGPVLALHLVASGSCSVQVGAEPRFRVETGDLLAQPIGESLGPPLAFCDPGPEWRKISAVLVGDALTRDTLAHALPAWLHLARWSADDRIFEQLIGLAESESRARQPGRAGVLARFGDLLFVEIVRRHLAPLGRDPEALLGVRDLGVRRALQKLRDRPSQAWTLARLARESGMSRSALAEHFTETLGISPMRYLSERRVELATAFLSHTSLTLSEIADRVGYGSDAALSRAYKRIAGVAPANWRKTRQPKAG